MDKIDNLIEHYRAINERLKEFITMHSSIIYLEGSNDIVEGGAYCWRKLESDKIKIQDQLCLDYIEIFKLLRLFLESNRSKYLELFDKSCEDVLDVIRHTNILWTPCQQTVYQGIKHQLDLQVYFVSACLD